MYSMGAIILGVQLVSIGLLAEMFTAYNSHGVDNYSIAETTPPHSERLGPKERADVEPNGSTIDATSKP
jgi:hypothetical protein